MKTLSLNSTKPRRRRVMAVRGLILLVWAGTEAVQAERQPGGLWVPLPIGPGLPGGPGQTSEKQAGPPRGQHVQFVSRAGESWFADVALSGQYAVVRGVFGLTFWQLDESQTPHPVGYYYGSFVDFAVRGRHVAILETEGVLRVVDCGNLQAPRPVGSCEVPGRGRALVVRRSCAYVVSDAGLSVVDLSNVTKPTVIGHVSRKNGTAVAVDGNLACVGKKLAKPEGKGERVWGEIEVFDLSDPRKPESRTVLTGMGPVHDLAARDGHAYAVDGNMVVIDLRDPARPEVVGGCPLGGRTRGVHLTREGAYLASGEFTAKLPAPTAWEGVRVADISDPRHPKEAGFCEVPSVEPPMEEIGVSAQEPYVCLAGRLGLMVFRLTGPLAADPTRNHPPHAPRLLGPLEGDTVPAAPVFRLCSTDPDGDRLAFKLEILRDGVALRQMDGAADDAGWDAPRYECRKVAAFGLGADQRLDEGTYKWRASTFDGHVWGPLSEAVPFRVVP